MPHITVNGTSLWVEDSGGNAPAIVFSHSLFFDSTMFAPLAARFAGSFRTIAYDHRGQGKSSLDPGDDLSLDILTADAAALIETLGAGPCHFVGNSLGGFVALRLAARCPELLLSATILGSSAEAEHKVAEFAPLVDAMREHGSAPVIDTLMYIMFGDSFLADPACAETRNHWRNAMEALPNAIADSAAAVVFRKPVLAELDGCQVPLLAVAGAEDHAYGESEARHAAEAAGGRWTTIERAGHSLALERPDEVHALLADHFARAAASPAHHSLAMQA